MALITLTLNVDRLATAIEAAMPIFLRIADALDRAYPPPMTTLEPPSTPAGADKHSRVTPEMLRKARHERQRA